MQPLKLCYSVSLSICVCIMMLGEVNKYSSKVLPE